MHSCGARKHLEHGLDCCVYFGRSLDGSGGIRPFRKRLCSACIMAQPRAAAADGACNVQRMQSVTVPAAAKGPLRALALGLDDKHRFCVCMIELVQLACVNNVVSLLLMKTLAVHLSRSACMRSASTEADAASTSITCSVVCPFWPSSSLPDP